jgi:hypothetical protein
MGVTFSSGNMTTVVVVNNGTGLSEIPEVWINSAKQTFTSNSTEGFILPKNWIIISIFYTYLNGIDYDFKMVSERGTMYLFTATAL